MDMSPAGEEAVGGQEEEEVLPVKPELVLVEHLGEVGRQGRLGPQQNQGKRFYREAGFTEWSCVWTLPPDQEEAPAWQRQTGPGAERDSCSCLGMGLTGTGSGAYWAETVSRESREKFPVLFGLIEQYQEVEKM